MNCLILLLAVFTVDKALSITVVDSCKSLSLRNGGVHMSYLRREGKWHPKATFLCFYGFNRYGAYSAFCETSGDWSEDTPICDVLCAPLRVANGLVEYSKSAFNGDYLTDTVASFTCNSGYTLRGPNSRTCKLSEIHSGTGVWTGQTSRCEVEQKCGAIGLPSNGGMTSYPPPRHFGNGYTVEFSCPAGKTLVGPTTSTCQDGKWSHRPQSCETQ